MANVQVSSGFFKLGSREFHCTWLTAYKSYSIIGHFGLKSCMGLLSRLLKVTLDDYLGAQHWRVFLMIRDGLWGSLILSSHRFFSVCVVPLIWWFCVHWPKQKGEWSQHSAERARTARAEREEEALFLSWAKRCRLADASVIVKCSLILIPSLLHLAEFWCQLVNRLGWVLTFLMSGLKCVWLLEEWDSLLTPVELASERLSCNVAFRVICQHKDDRGVLVTPFKYPDVTFKIFHFRKFRILL